MTIPATFSALVARDGQPIQVEQADSSVLYGEGDVTVKVEYSCINYKDALAVTGKGKILRTYPIVPGIDYAGEVIASDSADHPVGSKVVLTGRGVGEGFSGGFAQYARAKSEWLLPLPASLSTQNAMQAGTAGVTAALCVERLLQSQKLTEGAPVAVSGASGGVGSFAVLLLSRLGYKVTAVSRLEATDYLTGLGASEVISRDSMAEPARPLEKSLYAGAVDTVGGPILARLLAHMKYGCTVAACGLAGDYKLSTNVMPFIIRGVTLAGIDSVAAPRPACQAAWELIANTITPADYATITQKTIGLADIPAAGEEIIAGGSNGRILVTP